MMVVTCLASPSFKQHCAELTNSVTSNCAAFSGSGFVGPPPSPDALERRPLFLWGGVYVLVPYRSGWARRVRPGRLNPS